MNKIIREHSFLDDRDMKKIFLLEEDHPMDEDTIPLFVSYPNCRPLSLRRLCHLYNRQHKPDEEQWKKLMSRSLLSFVRHPHPDQTQDNVIRIVGILRQNGADPNYRDRKGKDGFDYAYRNGHLLVLETLFCTYPKNPLHIIKRMLHEEKETYQRRPMLDLLYSIRCDFHTEKDFSETRMLTHLMVVHPLNIP